MRYNKMSVYRFIPAFSTLLIIVYYITSCKIYSFTGANIPPDIKTFSVELFQNRANNGPASLAQLFTDRLKQKMLVEANLNQVTAEADLQFKGAIVAYTLTSDAPVAGTSNALNRISITVQVEMTNNRRNDDSWKGPETFTRYAQYPSTEGLSSVEDQLVAEINKQLVDDIFQRALVKW
jgi:hypothetical protein